MDIELARAVVVGDVKQLRNLLQTKKTEATARNVAGDTLVMHALGSEEWMPEVIDALLQAGVDINARNIRGTTALARAMEAGWTSEAVRFLTSRGADPNIGDERGWTPLMIAIASEWDTDTDTIQALLEAGADANQAAHDGTTALALAEEAATFGDKEILEVLKQTGPIDK
jgi:ankyrin repeat protein